MADQVLWAGRYAVFDEIASGGMATVYLAARLGPATEWSRIVALKKLSAEFARQPDFVAMFFDEARLASRVRHPNVVTTYELLRTAEGLAIVMDFVLAQSLSRLLRRLSSPAPLPIAAAILTGALEGLHAAHDATDDSGRPLGIVHRDVSPHNILVGGDGVARVIDFGIAKAAGRLQTTDVGVLKGKLAYMAPEQIRGAPVDRRTDVYSAGIVLWEVLTGRRLFRATANEDVLARRSEGRATIPAPSAVVTAMPKGVDDLVGRALHVDPEQRFATALEMADAIRAEMPVADRVEVAAWVRALAGKELDVLEEKRAAIERSVAAAASVTPVAIAPPPDPRATPGALPFRPRVAQRAEVGRPASSRRGILGLGLLCLGLLAASVIAGPTVLKQRVLVAGTRLGLDLSVDHVELRRGGLAMMDATVTVPGCPEVRLSAGEVAIDLDWRMRARVVSFVGFEVTLGGDLGKAATNWSRWLAAPAAIRIVGRGGHLVWIDALTRGIDLEALDVSLDGADGFGIALDTANAVVNVPRGHMGPWKLHLDAKADGASLTLGFDPSMPDGPPSAVLKYGPSEGTTVVLDIPRGSTFKVGVPPELFGLASTPAVEALLRARLPPAGQSVEAEARVGLYGLAATRPFGTVPMDVVVEGAVGGLATEPLDIRLGKLTVSEAAGPMTGTVTLEPGGVRIIVDRPSARSSGGTGEDAPTMVFDTRDWTARSHLVPMPAPMPAGASPAP